MENLQRSLEKTVKSLPLSKKLKKPDSWILLAIDDSGKTISLGKLKKLVITLALVAVVVIASVLYLLVVTKGLSEENEKFRNALDASKKQVAALRDERDVFMVRSVLDKSGAENKLVDIREEQSDETSGGLPDKSASSKTIPDSADVDKTIFLTTEKQPAKKTDLSTQVKKPEASIDDFKVLFEPASNTLNVQFKIINISSDSHPVSGHAFVILKEHDIDNDNLLIFPRVAMLSGKPSHYKKGQYFSIYRFKTVRFNAQNETEPLRFKNAIILVYSVKGDLLLEKEYPVQIQGMESILTE